MTLHSIIMKYEDLTTCIKENHHLLTAFGLFAALSVYFTEFMVKTENTEIIVETLPLITLCLMLTIGVELYLNFRKGYVHKKDSTIGFMLTAFILGLLFLNVLIVGYILTIYYSTLYKILNFSLIFITVTLISYLIDEKRIYTKIKKKMKINKFVRGIVIIFSSVICVYGTNAYDSLKLESFLQILEFNLIFSIFFSLAFVVVALNAIIVLEGIYMIYEDIKKILHEKIKV